MNHFFRIVWGKWVVENRWIIWEILERIKGTFWCIIGSGLATSDATCALRAMVCKNNNPPVIYTIQHIITLMIPIWTLLELNYGIVTLAGHSSLAGAFLPWWAFFTCIETVGSNLLNSILLIYNDISGNYCSRVIKDNLIIVETALMPIDAVIPLRALCCVAECHIVRRCHHPLTARSNIAPKHCSMAVSSTCIFMTFRRIRGEIHPHSKPHPRWDMCCNKFLIKSPLADSTYGTRLFIAQLLWFRYVTLQNCAMEVLFYVWWCTSASETSDIITEPLFNGWIDDSKCGG